LRSKELLGLEFEITKVKGRAEKMRRWEGRNRKGAKEKGLWSGVVTNGLRKGKSEGQVDCCGETTQH
jgi:hypothetical protein